MSLARKVKRSEINKSFTKRGIEAEALGAPQPRRTTPKKRRQRVVKALSFARWFTAQLIAMTGAHEVPPAVLVVDKIRRTP